MCAADANNASATVTTPGVNAISVVDPGPIKVGSVFLRGVTVVLDTDVGQAFVIDCARNTEGLMPDSDIKDKWTLTDEAWERLADICQLSTACAPRARSREAVHW